MELHAHTSAPAKVTSEEATLVAAGRSPCLPSIRKARRTRVERLPAAESDTDESMSSASSCAGEQESQESTTRMVCAQQWGGGGVTQRGGCGNQSQELGVTRHHAVAVVFLLAVVQLVHWLVYGCLVDQC